MDWGDIREFFNTINGAYVAGAAGALVTLTAGYFSGRKSGNKMKDSRAYELRREELVLEGQKIELERAKLAGDPIQLKQLEYAETQRVHERQKELDQIERDRTLEDADRNRKTKLEDIARQETSEQARMVNRLNLVREISGTLAPIIVAYTEATKAYFANPDKIDTVLDKTRQEYRAGIIDEILEGLKKDYSPHNEEYDLREEDLERVDRLVNARHPLPETSNEPKMPEELKRLLSLLPKESSE